MKLNIRKGFSLAELGIALVILLIVSTIAVISYFSIIDNAKEVKIVEDSKTLQLALARQEVNLMDYSIEYKYEDLDSKIQDVLNYHLEKGTNLKGVVFPNEVFLDNEGNYVLGELKVKKSEIDTNTTLLDILNVTKVKAGVNNSFDLEVRKLDNNKMNKLIQENLTDDWFIISDISYTSSNLSHSNEVGSLENVPRISEVEALELGYTVIKTADQLNNIRSNVKGKYILMNNIDLDIAPYNDGEGWEPIRDFYGELNGNGYVIKNLFINRPEDNKVGLFASSPINTINARIIVKDLGLVNVDIKGKAYVGGLFGTVSKSKDISNIFIDGSITGLNYVGGLAGTLGGYQDIINIHSSANIEGNTFVGGITSRIEDSYGLLYSSFTNGKLTRLDGKNPGGIVGTVGVISAGSRGSVWDIEAAGTVFSSGNSNDGRKTTEEMKNPQTYLDLGWDNKIHDNGLPIWRFEEGSYPKLWFEK